MDATSLRYVEAERLDSEAGALNDVTLLTENDVRLGTLDGVLVNPRARQVCYYIVKSSGWFSTQRYLIPAALAQLQPERHTLRVEVDTDDVTQLARTNPKAFAPFSDLDVVDAMFGSRPE